MAPRVLASGLVRWDDVPVRKISLRTPPRFAAWPFAFAFGVLAEWFGRPELIGGPSGPPLLCPDAVGQPCELLVATDVDELQLRRGEPPRE